MTGKLATALGMLVAVAPASTLAADRLPPEIAQIVGSTIHYRLAAQNFEMYVFDDADGRYEAVVTPPGGAPMRMTGTWRVSGNQICRDQTAPSPAAGKGTICEPFAIYLGLD